LPQLGEVAETFLRSLPVGQTLPVRPIMQRLIAEQLSRAIVGRSSGTEFDDLVCFQSTLIYATLGNFTRIRVRWPRYRRAKAALLELARNILEDRRMKAAAADGDGTIADLALSARVDGQLLSEGDLAIIVLGPYIAGLDTAANTAVFLIYELLRHPALLERVVSEIDEAFRDGVPSAQKLRSMRAFRGAFLETLRLHPVAPSILRHAVESFEFHGYHVEAGQEILLGTSIPHFLPQSP
jgi:cytochrome P450